ncbi:Uncharacterised protein [Klebsiella pneumoniae]|nr:Uncharacterised protein [Klebsiella pneumoniae]
MPRYRLMVPMVITMDDRLKRVTSKPLNRPHSRPTPRPMTTSSGVSIPAAAQKPITVELSAIVEATDRSISRAIISIAIGRTTIAFSVKVKVASDRFQILRKYGEATALPINTARVTASKNPSQHSRRRSGDGAAGAFFISSDTIILLMISPPVSVGLTPRCAGLTARDRDCRAR